MNECPICGSKSVDITTHEDSDRRYLCTGAQQHEWRPTQFYEPNYPVEEEPKPGVRKTLRDLLRKAF